MLRLAICIITVIIPTSVLSQSMPDVPFDVEFANVTVHLTQLNRLKVKQEIQQFYAHRATVDYIVGTTRQLAPHLTPLLKESNLPNDFIYAAIPSSDVDTLGFWGLSQTQGRRLKLRMDERIDERFHLLSSTTAVLSDLGYWQKLQNNYIASLLCYLNSKNLPVPDETSPYYFLPGTNSNALFWQIIARKLIVEHENSLGHNASAYRLYDYRYGTGKTLQEVANQLHMSMDRLTPVNRWLKARQLPIDQKYPLFIPVKPDELPQLQPFEESRKIRGQEPKVDVGFPVLVKIPEQNRGIRSSVVSYLINGLKGIQAHDCDNLITLAFYGNISLKAFLKYNDLSDSDRIHAGSIYYLEPKLKRAKIPFHIVQKEQTLRTISAIYGVKLKSLEKFNHISAIQRLQPGRVLWLQRKRSKNQSFEYLQQPERKFDKREEELPLAAKNSVQATAHAPVIPMDSLKISNQDVADTLYNKRKSEAILEEKLAGPNKSADRPYDNNKSPQIHKVKLKETYYSIARLHSITIQQLYAWNNRSEWDILKVGDELIVRSLSGKSNQPNAERPKSGMVTATHIPDSDIRKDVSFYTVQSGQTLYHIAQLNKVSVSELMRWNDLVTFRIKIGQKLTIRK